MNIPHEPCPEAKKILDELEAKYGPVKMMAFSASVSNLVRTLHIDDECVAQYGVAMRLQLDYLKQQESEEQVEVE